MSLSISIAGSAPAELNRFQADLVSDGAKQAAGGGVRKLLMEYFRQLDSSRANQLGGRRSHYYAQTARNVSFETTDSGALVHIHQLGIALHYYGGTITPTNGHKMLTIPVDPEAYGRRASEFDNLEIAWGRSKDGRVRPIGLVSKSDWKYSIKKNRKTGVKEVAGATYAAGKWMFALVYSATLDPDPSILPSDALVQSAALDAVTAYVVSKMRGHI